MTTREERIDNVRYDAQTQRYHGAITYAEANGISVVQVTAHGRPGWGYARTLHTLSEAGARARANLPKGGASSATGGTAPTRPA